jgi:hypothetical protein
MDNPRFYVNPLTGRTIKSTGKIFQNLRKNKFVINKHTCLYNIDSAKRCLKRILNKYSNVYPPSSFVNIPLTLKSNGELDYIRAFIKDKTKLKGYITKDGSLYKFRKDILVDIKKKYPFIKYASKKDSKNLLERLENEGNKIPKKIQKKINKYLHNITPRCDSINILYNPVQKDFIPINSNDVNKKELLDNINNMLIPKEMVVPKKNKSGLEKEDDLKLPSVLPKKNKSGLKLPSVLTNEELKKSFKKRQTKGRVSNIFYSKDDDEIVVVENRGQDAIKSKSDKIKFKIIVDNYGNIIGYSEK